MSFLYSVCETQCQVYINTYFQICFSLCHFYFYTREREGKNRGDDLKKNAWSEETLARGGIFMILWVMVSSMPFRKWKAQVKTNTCKKLKKKKKSKEILGEALLVQGLYGRNELCFLE